jgi:hypothetical protein
MQLRALPDEEILRWPKFGRATVRELRTVLNRLEAEINAAPTSALNGANPATARVIKSAQEGQQEEEPE